MPPNTFDIILVIMVRSGSLVLVPGSILIRLRLGFWSLSLLAKDGFKGAIGLSPPVLSALGPWVGRLAR